MNDDNADYSDWRTYPPWVLFDPDTKAEWVMPETPRYYVANVKGTWFICDRFPDVAVNGTESKSRADAIRKFYRIQNRPMPEGWSVPHPVKGTQNHGP